MKEFSIVVNMWSLFMKIIGAKEELELNVHRYDGQEDNFFLRAIMRGFSAYWSSHSTDPDAVISNSDDVCDVSKIYKIKLSNDSYLESTLSFDFIITGEPVIMTASNFKVVRKENDKLVRSEPSDEQCSQFIDRINSTIQKMENTYTKRKFISNLFDEFHSYGVTTAKGSDAESMYTIFNSANYHYPKFANLPYRKQLKVLVKGFARAHGRAEQSRDIYVYCKGVFDEFTNGGMNLCDVLVRTDPVLQKTKRYVKKWEKRVDRRDPMTGRLFEKDSLIFIDYEYVCGGYKLRSSFHCSDLWLLLTGNRGAEEFIS